MKRVIRLIFDSFIVISLISCTDNKPSIINSSDISSIDSYESLESLEPSESSIEEISSESTSIEDPSSKEIIINTYTVTWLDYDEKVLKIDTDVKEGETPNYTGDIPTRSNDDTYSYTFTGWTPTIEVVSKDITYTATYKAEPLPTPTYYHVEFVNYNGSLLYEVDVLEGEEAIYVGDIPTRPSDDVYRYEFNGWDKDLKAIDSDTTIMATYKSIEIDWGSLIWF